MGVVLHLLLSLIALAAPSGTPETVSRGEVLGRSVEGRPIRVLERGNPASGRRILVVGCIHGNECAGIVVARRLARTRPLIDADLWIVPVLNPDGRAAGTRQNARGVDLNRNFASEWRPSGRRWDPEYPGPRPYSEPESRIARALVLRLRPDVTIWYHQPQRVVRAWGRSVPAARRYARLSGRRFGAIRWPPGSAPNWQNHRFARGSSYVVELPPGRLSARAAARHARTVRLLARYP